MSIYLVKSKGWRYDFTQKGTRHTKGWFKTKKDANAAEAKRKEELLKPPPPPTSDETIPIDMDFLELVNRRLDHVKAYNSERHYMEYRYMAKRWIARWKDCACDAISQGMVESLLLERKRISSFSANKELRYLRATFNHGRKKGLISHNPTEGGGGPHRSDSFSGKLSYRPDRYQGTDSPS